MENNVIRRGEIYLADLGCSRGYIQRGVRPVIIISNRANNKFAPIVNVLPITSRTKTDIPVHVNIAEESGLLSESTILTEQILTINKSQLIKPIGVCSEDKMLEIAQAVMLQMQLLEMSELLQVV